MKCLHGLIVCTRDITQNSKELHVTLTRGIELYSRGYVCVPLRRTDSNVASFNDGLKVMTNNWVPVCIS